MSAPVHAEYWIGVGSGMAAVDVTVGDESQDDLTLEATLRAGAQLNKHFSVEVQLGVGTGGFFELDELSCQAAMDQFGGDASDCDGGPADLDDRDRRALFVRAQLPNRSWFTPYVLAGYSYNKLTFDGGSGSTSTTVEDLGFGFGVSISSWFRVEWLQQSDKKDIKINSTSFNLTIPF